MNHNYYTVHLLTALPKHNLNADENGLPKQVRQGGVPRGVLSAQSLKRAARVRFETQTGDTSYRSGALAEEAVRRAVELAAASGVTLDEDAATAAATAAIQKFANGKKAAPAAGSEETRKNSLLWLSDDELDALTTQLAESQDPSPETIVANAATSSLAIAAFGRMFAAEPGLSTHAAVAVGPAVTTHPIVIETDSFTAVDDLATHGGAGHLGQMFHTSGVYYRSFTVDRAQLRRNWLAWGDDKARDRLAGMFRSLVLALPTGGTNSTAADILPSFIVAEQQRHRCAYSFDKPVNADETGGFVAPSVAGLLDMAAKARAFDPDQFAGLTLSGVDADLSGSDETPAALAELTDSFLAWVSA